MDALLAGFGVSNKLNVPVLLDNEWRAREAIRLVYSPGVHSLAWEPAVKVVRHKDALACFEFFATVLHPAWAAQNERARALLGVVSSSEANARSRERYAGAGAVPPASAPAVEAALADALEGGRKVRELTVRRSKSARRAKRGLAFAVVDGQTVFVRRPDEFGPRVTAETDDVLRLAVQDPASLAVDERALLEATGNAGPRVGGHTQQRTSACTVCGNKDRVHLILLCDGCDADYHTTCLVPPLPEVPTSDWFCQDCVADRDYLYDHASWGDAVRTLVRLASQHGVWTAKGEAATGKPLEKRIREWQDNDVIKRARSAH